MKAILGATSLCLGVITMSVAPAMAQDINIYVYGEEGAILGSGPHAEGRGRHMRDRSEHHRGDHGMHHGRGHHGSGDDRPHREEGRAHPGGERGGKMGRGMGMQGILDLIELYDQDGDDRVTQGEIDKLRADRLAAFDSDGDGMLSLQEYEMLWLDAMRERMVDRFQSHDDDGDGRVTVDEFSKRTSRLVMRRDRNGDGAIGLDDLRRDHHGHRRMRDRDTDK
jgi:hypothetical protein